MSNFKNIELKHASNIFSMIGKEWMLITAGTEDNYNTMTASWGTMGELWFKPVAIIFVRPQRYTLGFLEKYDCFSLSFFTKEYRNILNYCGTVSGRVADKAKATGLTPVSTDLGNIYFEQARLVLECRKIYSDSLKPQKIIDAATVEKIYPNGDYHRMFIGEIIGCFAKE